MANSTVDRNSLKPVINQPNRKTSNQNDLLAKIRPSTPNKPNLVQHLTRSNPIQVSSGLKILSTRIQSNNDPSYQPLVTISDNDDSEKEDFVSPIHKLTKDELREELKTFRQNDDSNRINLRSLLTHNSDDDDDNGAIEFRTHQTTKRSVCCYQYPFTSKESFCIIS